MPAKKTGWTMHCGNARDAVSGITKNFKVLVDANKVNLINFVNFYVAITLFV